MSAQGVLEAQPRTPRPRERTAWWRRRTAQDLFGLAVIAAVVVIAYFEIPFAGRTFTTSSTTPGVLPCEPARCYATPSDDPRVDRGASAWQSEPWARVVHDSLADREVPLWNPYEGIGQPLAADPPTAAFDPLSLAVHLRPTPLVEDLTSLAVLVLIGMATFWAVRMIGMSPLAATVSGSVFALSGWFVVYSNNPWFSNYLYLPLMIGSIEWALRARRWLPVAFLALAVAGLLFVGMPEPAFMTLVAVALYTVVRLATGPVAGRWWRGAVRVLSGSVVGLLLAGPLVIPFLEFLRLSQNTHAKLGDLPPETDALGELVAWLVPKITDVSTPRNWVGVGAALLVLAAFVTPKVLGRFSGWPFVAMGGLVAVQVYGGGLVSWTRHVPFWSQASWPRFGTPILAFSLAALAGVGIEVLRARALVVRRFLVAVALLVLLALLLASGAPWPLALSNNVDWLRGWPLAGFIVAAVVAAVLLVDPRWRAPVVAGAVVVASVLLVPHGFYAARSDPYPTTRWLGLLQSQTARDQSRVFSTDGILFPDSAGVYGLSDPRMLDALYIQRYWRYLRAFVSHGLDDRFVASGFTETAPDIAGNQMFDLLGVRYLVFRSDSAGPPKWSSPQYRLVYHGEGVKVYENTHVAPRAFVVHDVHQVGDEDAALRALRKGETKHFPDGSPVIEHKDLTSSAVVESNGSRLHTDDCSSADDSAHIVERHATRVVVDVDAQCAGMMVLTDAYYPGWTARVNGRDATIHPTDVAFRGVEVPAGRSRVVFEYRPASFRAGLALAAIGLLGLVAFGVLGMVGIVSHRRRPRRRGRAAVDDRRVKA